ncbi:methionyl-tRNA formyltransferase [Haloarchaeobius salinus]|uniref:methionyl-tRNA formyltransferase n=1 Tax=Haloarchaeobius salinus TaxID=1198298 RepID=UPI00210F0057|nr:methionyl-tRNA formyltransferase [Haloarchaeobius salinus]
MSCSVLFLGNKERGTLCLEALLDSRHEIVAVVAPPADSTEDWYRSPVPVAEEHGIPVHRPADVNDPEVVRTLADHEPDLTVMAGYSQILGSEVLNVAPEGTLNLHGGKLPSYRGASTLNWMLINGEEEGGIAVLFADEGIDTGDIVAQERFDIAEEDTIVDVVERTNELFPGMLVDAVDAIDDGTVKRTPQSHGEGTYWHSRRPRDGEIDWQHMTARNVHDLVRSLAGPYPSAYTHHDEAKLEITETSVPDEDVRGIPGRVARTRGQGVLVVAADRAVLVEHVQPEGGEEQPAREYFSGVGVDLG